MSVPAWKTCVEATAATIADGAGPERDMEDEPRILRFPGLDAPVAHRPAEPIPPSDPNQPPLIPPPPPPPPPTKPKKPSQRLPDVLSDQEQETIVGIAETEWREAKTKAKKLQKRRYLEIVRVAIYCGLRVSELCNLTVDAIDFDRGMLRVNLGKGRKDRVLPLPKKVEPTLREWLGDRRDGYVFPGRGKSPLCVRSVQLEVIRLKELAVIKKRITPHALRHTFATTRLHHGATIREVQEMLGHGSVATTQRYTRVLPERLREAMDK